MLYEQSEVRMRLERLAWRSANGSGEAEDMLEEATVYLWSIEKERPGQSVSWYLESCRRRLRDVRRSGRSVDARKRRRNILHIAEEDALLDVGDVSANVLVAREDTFGDASAVDLLGELESHLDGISCAVLRMVIEGESVREVARALGISASAVQRRVCTMRNVARRLGIWAR